MTYYLVAGCGCGGCNLIAIDETGNIVSIYLPLSAFARQPGAELDRRWLGPGAGSVQVV